MDRARLRMVLTGLVFGAGGLCIGYGMASKVTMVYVLGLLLSAAILMWMMASAVSRTSAWWRQAVAGGVPPVLVLALGFGVPLLALHGPAHGEVRWQVAVDADEAIPVGDHVAVATGQGLQLRNLEDGSLAGTVPYRGQLSHVMPREDAS